MNQPSALVFDLDDTLIAERDYAFSGFRAVAESYSRILGDPAKSSRFMQEQFDGGNKRRVFNALVAEFLQKAERQEEQAASEDMIKSMINTYRAHKPSITLLPDAADALLRYRNTHRLGLISDGPHIMQSRKTAALELSKLIECIILTAELGEGLGKPHPRAYEVVADTLGVPHQRCIYVADNPSKDFVAPRALGWKAIRIIRPDGIYRDAETAPNGAPHHVITSLDELDDLL